MFRLVVVALTGRFVARAILGLVLFALHTIAVADNPARFSAHRTTIPELLLQFSQHSKLQIPDFLPEEFDALVAGKSVINAIDDPQFLLPGDKVRAMGLLGFQVVAAPRKLVWLTLLGGGGRRDGRLTSAMLARFPAGAYARYQHVNLPWPFRDRHWVIHCEKNVALARASDGVIWEHRWALHNSGKQLLQVAYEEGRIPLLDQRDLDTSVYLPANRGTWVLFDLGQSNTLILAFYNSDLGGRLPGKLVKSFSKRQLRKYLESTQATTELVQQHYAGKTLIHDGFGMPISYQDAVDAVRQWKNQSQLPAVN